MRRSRLVTVAAGLAAGSLMLTACGDDGGGDETATDDSTEEASDSGDEAESGDADAGAVEATMISEADTANCDPTAQAAPMPDPEGTGEDETTIQIGKFPGWDENEVVIELAKVALEEQGYTVEVQELDVGANYTGVADGDLDVMMDAWLPGTHGAQYVDMDSEDGAQLGDSLENLGCWFDQGFLTIAVNEDSPAQSLDELAENSEAYGSRLVGIDPGAGLTRVTRENVIPTYGLEDWEYPTSSGTAMLSELESAMSAGENIAVTLWHPHWAYAAYDIRDLEDPEGTLGTAERLYNLGREGFTEDFPNAAQLMKNLYLTNEQLLALEDLLVLEYEREDNEQAIQDWLDENPDFMENWRAGEL